jgi:hypothetical protein
MELNWTEDSAAVKIGQELQRADNQIQQETKHHPQRKQLDEGPA